MKKIFIVDGEAKTIYALQNFFQNRGFCVRATTQSLSCLPEIVSFSPHLVLVGYEDWGQRAFENGRMIEAQTNSAVLFMVRNVDSMFLNGLQGLKTFAYLKRPMSLGEVYRTVEFTINNVRKINSLEKRLLHLEKRIRREKDIQRAKNVLMENKGISEWDAYNEMRSESMNRSCALYDVVKEILLANGLKNSDEKNE